MTDKPIPRDPGPRGPKGGKLPTAKGGKGKGRNKHKGPKFIGGHGAYQGVNKHQLNQLIQSQMQAILNPIKNERKDVRRQTRDDMDATKKQYRRATGDINHIYDETGKFIGGNNEATAKGWEQAKAESASNTAALIAQTGLNQQASAGGANDELSRLGISGAGFLDGTNSDADFAGMLARQSGANSSANISMSANAAASVGNLLLGMNEGSRNSALGQAMNDKRDAMDAARNDRRDALADINDALREARQQRPGLFQQLFQQLQQSGWGMYVDQQNLNQQQQQINLQRQAQVFAQNQARQANARAAASAGSSSGGSSSGSSGSTSSSGTSHGGYYGVNNDLLLGALLGPGKKGGRKKGGK